MNNLASRTLDLAIQIQQIPSPTFQEKERAEFVRDLFLSEKLEDVEIDETGNVLGCYRSRLSHSSRYTRPVVVTAHLDTVFPTSVDLTIHNEGERIYGPGLGDNSLGIAGLLGLSIDTDGYSSYQLNVLAKWYQSGTEKYEPNQSNYLLEILEMNGIDLN